MADDAGTRRRVGRPTGGLDEVRRSLLTAALNRLLETGDPARVTVAAVVAEAGCTPPALYHYWPTRDLLLREASALGWQQFRDSQAVSVLDLVDPVERIRERGRSYVRFAASHPSLFRVLFLTPEAMAADRPAAPEGDALADLVADVATAMRSGALRPGDPWVTAVALWSSVHGVAALKAVTPTFPDDMVCAVAATAQDAVLAGLAA